MEEYQVEAILGKKGNGAKAKYLIKWEGYDHSEKYAAIMKGRKKHGDNPLISIGGDIGQMYVRAYYQVVAKVIVSGAMDVCLPTRRSNAL